MRQSKEIVILVVLFLVMAAGVLWYVADRRAKNRALPPVAASPLTPATTKPVDLTRHDGETIDFSSGKGVVKNSAADKAALDAGLKDIADATKDVTFGPTPPAAKKTDPAAKP